MVTEWLKGDNWEAILRSRWLNWSRQKRDSNQYITPMSRYAIAYIKLNINH